MHNRIKQTIATLVLATLSPIIAADDYVPWGKDDFAVYESDSFEIIKKSTVDFTIGSWRHFTEFGGLGKFWVYANPLSENVYLYSSENNSLQYFVDFDSAVGTTTSINVPPCNTGNVVVAAKNQSLSIPAGNFNQVVRLDLQTSCADAGVSNMWFAKGVGPVQWAETNITGRVLFSMLNGHINGQNYPKSSGIVLRGQFPDPTLWIDRMPIIPDPPPIKTTRVGMTIENHSREVLSYDFSSSQKFDIYIYDERGNLVSKWSRGKGFLTVVTHVEIPPGESFRVGGEVELAYDDGQPLKPGNYKLRIFLTNYNALDSTDTINVASPASEMPVNIQWAY